jgi:hypothetical protein
LYNYSPTFNYTWCQDNSNMYMRSYELRNRMLSFELSYIWKDLWIITNLWVKCINYMKGKHIYKEPGLWSVVMNAFDEDKLTEMNDVETLNNCFIIICNVSWLILPIVLVFVYLNLHEWRRVIHTRWVCYHRLEWFVQIWTIPSNRNDDDVIAHA